MKNLKKFLALIVAIAVIASFSLPAFSATMTDSQICTSLGLLKGDGSGVTDAYLAKGSTRLQAAIISLRLMGVEATALGFIGDDNFSDASTVNWTGGQNILAYLKANPDYGWIGNPDGTFDPYTPMTAQMMYKVMLEALGYAQDVDYTWSETLGFAKALGLKKAALLDDFTNADIATVIVEALNTMVKNSTITLAQSLVDSKIINRDAAVAAGLIPVFAVKGLSGSNLSQVNVTFNDNVDATTVVAANFKVAGVAPAAVALSADKKTVTLTVPVANYDLVAPFQYAVSVTTAVKNEFGNALAAAYSNTVTISDTTQPTVTGTTLVGPNTFTVNFSEPVLDNTPVVKVNNGMYAVASVAAAGTGSTSILVTLGAAALPAANYTISVSGYKDLAGLTLTAVDTTLAYAPNTTAITATAGTATLTTVVVTFNKTLTTGLGLDYFRHDNRASQAIAPDSVTTTDNKTFVVTFTTTRMPAGTVGLTIYKTGFSGASAAITDTWNNTLAANIVLSVTAAQDTTAPTATVTSQTSDTTFRVTYSEAVTGATTLTNYVVKTAGGTTIGNPATVTLVAGTTATYDVALGATQATGAYTVTISGVTDNAIPANAIAAVTLGFNLTDITAPNLAAAGVTATFITTPAGTPEYIYVTFIEGMATTGAGSVLDPTNYRFLGAALPATATIANFSGNVYRISLPDGTAIAAGNILTLGQLADASGNRATAFATDKTLAALAAPTAASVTVKATSLTTITLTVGATLVTVPVDGIMVTNNALPAAVPAYVSFTYDGLGNTVITATLQSGQQLLGTGAAALPTDVSIVASKLLTNTGLFVGAGSTAAATDGIAPSITTAAKTAATEITLTYNEDIAAGNVTLIATDFVVTKGTTVLVAGTDYTYAVVDATHATITLGAAPAAGVVVTVATKSPINYLKDLAGNVLNAASKSVTF